MKDKRNKQLVLKPQDLLLVLKLCASEASRSASFAVLAKSIGLTASETHAAVERAELAGLIRRDRRSRQAIKRAVTEFVIHGAKYAFPAVRGRISRGVPTSYGAKPLNEQFGQTAEPPPVWPSADGSVRGPSLVPLYPSAPGAALEDPRLYELLALFDALREGSARERDIARRLLVERLS